MARLKSFFGNLFRRRPSVGQASQQSAPSEASKSRFRDKAVQSMKYVVMHSYKAKRKRHRKTHRNKLSYVSAAILEDYGSILPRRQRKLLMMQGIPFTPYYN